MNKLNGVILLFILISGSMLFADQEDYTTYAEGRIAKSMVTKAEKYYENYGLNALMEEINNPEGIFVAGEFYLFAHNLEGIVVAHGTNQTLIGRNVINVKTPDGFEFVKEFIRIAKEEGEGWVENMWTNPVSGKLEPKITFVKRLKQSDVYIACGFYL